MDCLGKGRKREICVSEGCASVGEPPLHLTH